MAVLGAATLFVSEASELVLPHPDSFSLLVSVSCGTDKLHQSATSRLEFPLKSIYHRRHESLHLHRSSSSRTHFRCLWFQRVSAFPSHAANPAEFGRRLPASVFHKRLHLRYRGDANRRRVALAHRALRPARPNDSRRNHLQHIGFPRTDGARRFRASPRRYSIGGLSPLALPRCFRQSPAGVGFFASSFQREVRNR